MARKSERGARESSLAQGWIVEDGSQTEKAAPSAGPALPTEFVPADGPGESGESRHPQRPVNSPAAARGQFSNGAMVLLGVLGGLYLVYTWIWFTWAKFYVDMVGASLSLTSGSFGAVLQLIIYWAAVFAPALWFISVMLLNRGARLWRLALWLLVGAVVLAPLPYFMWGA